MNTENTSTGQTGAGGCHATNKKRELCSAPATDTGFCFLHSKPGRAAEVGREGGRRNRQVADPTLPPLPDLSTSSGQYEALTMIIRISYEGKTNARRMASLVLCSACWIDCTQT